MAVPPRSLPRDFGGTSVPWALDEDDVSSPEHPCVRQKSSPLTPLLDAAESFRDILAEDLRKEMSALKDFVSAAWHTTNVGRSRMRHALRAWAVHLQKRRTHNSNCIRAHLHHRRVVRTILRSRLERAWGAWIATFDTAYEMELAVHQCRCNAASRCLAHWAAVCAANHLVGMVVEEAESLSGPAPPPPSRRRDCAASQVAATRDPLTTEFLFASWAAPVGLALMWGCWRCFFSTHAVWAVALADLTADLRIEG